MTMSKLIVALAFLFVIAPANGVHAMYNADFGRWMQRDPIGYKDGPSLLQYVRSSPVSNADHLGLGAVGTACDPALRPTPATQQQWNTCCDEVLGPKPGGNPLGGNIGLTGCCHGVRVWCRNDPYIGGALVPSAIQAIKACVDMCEPRHCPNIECAPDDGDNSLIPPIWHNGAFGKACSECNVISCAIDCLEAKCGGNIATCTLCGDNESCLRWMRDADNALRKNKAINCGACSGSMQEVLGLALDWVS